MQCRAEGSIKKERTASCSKAGRRQAFGRSHASNISFSCMRFQVLCVLVQGRLSLVPEMRLQMSEMCIIIGLDRDFL